MTSQNTPTQPLPRQLHLDLASAVVVNQLGYNKASKQQNWPTTPKRLVNTVRTILCLASTRPGVCHDPREVLRVLNFAGLLKIERDVVEEIHSEVKTSKPRYHWILSMNAATTAESMLSSLPLLLQKICGSSKAEGEVEWRRDFVQAIGNPGCAALFLLMCEKLRVLLQSRPPGAHNSSYRAEVRNGQVWGGRVFSSADSMLKNIRQAISWRWYESGLTEVDVCNFMADQGLICLKPNTPLSGEEKYSLNWKVSLFTMKQFALSQLPVHESSARLFRNPEPYLFRLRHQRKRKGDDGFASQSSALSTVRSVCGEATPFVYDMPHMPYEEWENKYKRRRWEY